MFYKKNGLPEESEIVVCTIKKILPNSVFVDLDEYENKEGLIHISEISPGRIRNIRDFVKEGKKIVCKILSVNKEKNHIDLSLRRVNQAQRINKNNEYKQEQKSEKILEVVGKQNNIDIKEIYSKIGNKIVEEFGSLNECFQELIKNDTILKPLKLDSKLESSLIKETLKKVNDLSIRENLDCKILYAGAPNYRITLIAQNYKDAERGIEKMIETAEKEFKGKGTFEISKK